MEVAEERSYPGFPCRNCCPDDPDNAVEEGDNQINVFQWMGLEYRKLEPVLKDWFGIKSDRL